MLFKNVASQKALVFAYNKTTGVALTGDAANITANVSKDGAAPSASNDTNPTEIGGGWYAFDLTQAETNCDLFLLYAASATSNILVTGVSGYTTGGAIPQAGVAAAATALSTATWTGARAGYLDNINGHVAQTGDAYARLGAPAGASVSADIATRASQTSVNTIDDLIDTEVAAIKTVVDAIEIDTQDIQSRIPAALVSGRIDASVGAMAANTLTASALATDAVTEIQSGLASQTSVDTVDTVVDAIKLKTDNLPSDPADASDIIAAFSSLDTKVDTIDDLLDTEVAAIKAKTDLIPAAPAAVSDIPTTAQIADKILGRNIAGGSDGGRDVTSALRPLRNKVSRSGSTLTVTQEDDATSAWTATITTDGTVDPITAVDPA
jgi:hypothetical protein